MDVKKLKNKKVIALAALLLIGGIWLKFYITDNKVHYETKELELQKEYEDSKLCVGIIMIDNYEEIMQRKFEESVYGDGIIPYNTFKVFLGVIAKDIDEDKIKELYNHYQGKLDRGKNRNKNNAIDYLRNMREFLVRFIEENRIENQRRLMRVA